MAKDLSCHELVELITEYLEDELASEERARFEIHLVYCRGCANYLDQMRHTLDAMGELHEDALDPNAKDALMNAFRDWKRGTVQGG